MAEIPKDLPDPKGAAALRALETEADMYAISKLLHSGRILLKQGDVAYKKVRTVADWDRALLLAFSIVFMLIE
jgi:hypothetical protein